jgi:predicted transcriptional regulator
MAKKNQYTAKQVIAALESADGYVSKAASLLGCTPQTVYNYRDRYATVAEAWHSIRERRHDFVENALHKLIKEGNVTAIIFYLKTQAKERGYVERQEIDHGGKLKVEYVNDWRSAND